MNTPDSGSDGWFADLLSDTRTVITRLHAEPLRSLPTLRQDVMDYQRHVQVSATAVTDVDLANQLAKGLLQLMMSLQDTVDEAVHRTIQVAVRYFVESDDADDDLTSPYGFDDDAEVFNGAARLLGRQDLVLRVI